MPLERPRVRQEAAPPPPCEIRVLLDAECPLCLREGRLLERLDGGRGRIDLEDLSRPDFDPSKYGLTQAEIEARIHGILPDGRTYLHSFDAKLTKQFVHKIRKRDVEEFVFRRSLRFTTDR